MKQNHFTLFILLSTYVNLLRPLKAVKSFSITNNFYLNQMPKWAYMMFRPQNHTHTHTRQWMFWLHRYTVNVLWFMKQDSSSGSHSDRTIWITFNFPVWLMVLIQLQIQHGNRGSISKQLQTAHWVKFKRNSVIWNWIQRPSSHLPAAENQSERHSWNGKTYWRTWTLFDP